MAAQPDALQVIKRAVNADEQNWARIRNYAFVERAKKIDLDKRGRAKKVDIKTFDVTPLEGSPYRRLISRFDEPLSPEEEASENQRLRQSLAERQEEGAKAREKRLRAFAEKRDQNRAAVKEIPEAFDPRILGEETIAGRKAWLIALTPREGYRPANRRAKLFTRVRGRIWVDQETGYWARVEADLPEDLSFGWFLLRIYHGARVEVESQPVTEDLWAISRLWYTVALRIGLLKYANAEQEFRYWDFRRGPETAPVVVKNGPAE